MPDLEGQALSNFNAAQIEIKLICVGKRKCWKEDPYTCPSALTEMARDFCTLHMDKPEADGAVKFKCPYGGATVTLPTCGKCHRKGYCEKLKEYMGAKG
jgi:hypothetical protein